MKWLQSTKGNYVANNENRIGVYTYSSGTLNLVASSSNDGTLWSTATSATLGSKAFSSTYTAAQGMYYVGFLYSALSATTAPILGGGPVIGSGAGIGDFTNSGKIVGQLAAQTVLPASVAMSSVASIGSNFFLGLY